MSMDPHGIDATALAEYEEQAARALGVPVPDQAIVELDAFTNDVVPEREKTQAVDAVATPVVVAELLAFADRLNTLTGQGGPTHRDGFDAAIGAVREMIADRCDELGTKVEEL